ncbi:MAG: PAS domain S-box protein, partial [Anaerolineae bacterium]
MNDERKTKKQLIHQLAGLRQRVAELEAAETGRAQAEAKLRRANRALRVLSDCNQAVVRATEEASLRRQVCRILVETGGYRLAWIGFAEQDEARTMRPVAQAGFEEGYLQTLNLTWADTERGRGPTGTAIRSGQPALARNIPTDPNFAPWRAEATRRGYASSLALPLIAGGQTLGALNIYAAEPDAFDAKEISLLTELANDLAFGIATLRTRAEHRRAEAALRDSEARYRSLFDSTRDGLYVIDMQGRYLDANPAACRLLGYSRRELLAMDIFQVRAGYQTLSPEERAQLLARYQTLWQTGTTGYESLLAAKSGTTIPVEMSITPVNYHGRQAVLGAVRDITERKKAEQTLRESEQRLSLIFDTVGDALFLLAVEPNDVFRFESVNRAFLTATGLHEEQIVGRRIQEVIPESAHKLVLGKYKEAIREKKTVTWEEVSAYPSGEKTGLVAVTPAFNREGVCTQVVGSVHD